MKTIIVFFVCFIFAKNVNAQAETVYHGAADPVIIYNKQMKMWWM